MKPFIYHEPATVQEACALLAEYGQDSRVLAGGTDLVIQMKHNKIAPKHLVNIKNIPELQTITEDEQGMSIGAATPLSALVNHATVAKKIPMLAKAAHSVGSVQVRNRASIGGNICNAAPSADIAPGLLVLDTVLTVAGPEQERKLPIADFFTGPGTTVLQKGEVLTRLFIPWPEEHSGMIYLKHGPRQAMDCSVAGVALYLVINPEKNLCNEARLALGAVAPTPLRAVKAEKMICGKKTAELDFRATGNQAAKEASPITDVRASAAYRQEMVSVLTVKALEALTATSM